jgi:hypothetical protein
MFTVHKLVALHFVDGYENGKIVNHKNENKVDNRSDNLEWVTYSYNVLYSLSNRMGKNSRRIACDTPVAQHSLEGEFIKEWSSPIDIKHALGYSDWSIKECCKGKRKQAYGYKWRYAV